MGCCPKRTIQAYQPVGDQEGKYVCCQKTIYKSTLIVEKKYINSKQQEHLQFFCFYSDQKGIIFLNNTNNELKPMLAPLAPPRASGEPSCIII